MKKIVLIAALFLMLVGCSKSNNDEVINPNKLAIQGKWQLIEDLDYNPPGPYIITNGPIINIKADGTFTSTESPNYLGGTYSFSTNDIVDFNYTSTTFGNYTKHLKIQSLTANELILNADLSPDGTGCIEGCAWKYSKITTTKVLK